MKVERVTIRPPSCAMGRFSVCPVRAQMRRVGRFWRFAFSIKSISCVFSMACGGSTPPSSTRCIPCHETNGTQFPGNAGDNLQGVQEGFFPGRWMKPQVKVIIGSGRHVVENAFVGGVVARCAGRFRSASSRSRASATEVR